MKGIKCCGECAYYNMKKHKCMGGAQDPGKTEDSFYTDCPHVEVYPVRHGRWIELPKALNADEEPCKCSVCGHCLSFYNHYPKSKFCPNCGAKMYADGGTISKERLAEIMRGDDNG